MDGEAVGAAPDGGGEVGADDDLDGGGVGIGGAVAGGGEEHVGAGFGEGIGEREGGAGDLVGLPVVDGGGAFPDDLAVVGLAFEIIALEGLAEGDVAGPGDEVALGEAEELQLDGAEVDRAEGDLGGLIAGEEEEAGVEDQAGVAVGHRDGLGGFAAEGDAPLPRQPGAQRDLGGGAEFEAGDAEGVALAGYGGVGLGGLEADPIGGNEVGAAGGGAGEFDAGERGVAFGLGADAADEEAGGFAGVVQRELGAGVVGGALEGGFEGPDGGFGPVHAAERVGHDEEWGDFGGAGVG